MIRNNSGFSVPEVALAVILVSVLTVISFGDIASLINLNRQKQEVVRMMEIKKAFELYLEDNGSLPNQLTWMDDLTPYTNLSADQMQFDSWNNERHFRWFSMNQQFRDANFETYYGVVVSYGEDGLLDLSNATYGFLDLPGANNQDQPLANFGGNNNQNLNLYNGLNPSDENDVLFKVSDYKIKMDNYKVTSERLSAISAALQNYAQAQQNFAISLNELNWNTKIFYPAADYADLGCCADGATYGAQVIIDAQTFGAWRVQGMDANPGTRRNSMIRLMRMLGLPDSYCCSAMELAADNQPDPFFYSSNPRRKNSGVGCFNRNSNPTTQIILPPRLVVGQYIGSDCM